MMTPADDDQSSWRNKKSATKLLDVNNTRRRGRRLCTATEMPVVVTPDTDGQSSASQHERPASSSGVSAASGTCLPELPGGDTLMPMIRRDNISSIGRRDGERGLHCAIALHISLPGMWRSIALMAVAMMIMMRSRLFASTPMGAARCLKLPIRRRPLWRAARIAASS